MPSAPGTDYERLRQAVRRVRSRWRLRRTLQGAAVVLAVGFLVFALSAYGMDRLRFAPGPVTVLRVLAYATLLGLVLRFLVLPLSKRVSDERVALYVEEHEPSLQAALLSAVEMGKAAADDRAEVSEPLVERLVEEAARRCEAIGYGERIEHHGLHRSGTLLAGLAAAVLLALFLSPGFLRQAAPFLLVPWGGARASNPYSIEVVPGNVAVARGADQPVTARLLGFESDRVDVSVRTGSGEWKRSPMSADEASRTYRFILLDVDAPTEYFVEASGVRSPFFRIDVQDIPYVKRIDLEYRFPAYTGLAPRKVEDGGDIAALKGTEVQITVHPTVKVAGGNLVVEGERPAPLSPGPDGLWSGTVRVTREGFYKIELQGPDQALKPSSPSYAIEVLADQPPSIAFLKPGRDTRVTPIEEVFTEVKAEDDYGVERLELVYSVNGGPERTVNLRRGAPRKQLSAGHTFFLEELDLQPGDFISYFARATDANRVDGPKTSTTDIYFMEARPFGREYRQAQQRMQGGAGAEQGALSQRQREIIAATFKLVRDRKPETEKKYRDDLATLSMVQGRLKEQVETLVGRMTTRGILDTSPEFQKTADALKTAAVEMEAARDTLGSGKAKEALPPEQRALQQLQRAEASFRDVQVSFGGGGGGGGSADAEDLADLFELELDKLRNQYETVQRGQEQARDEQVDEALQRLSELARRQQQENERLKALAGGPPNQGGAGGGSQGQLARQAEELARKLERLAREQSSPSLRDSARRLQEAADAMKRSLASGKDGALSEGTSALDQLQSARRLLESNRTTRLDRDMQDALRRAEELASAQEKIASEVPKVAAGGGEAGERRQRLLERKDALAGAVKDLEMQLDRMARDSRRAQKEASRKLEEAAGAIRDQRLEDKIRYSKGLIGGRSGEYAQQFEGQISSDIADLGRRVQEAANAVSQSPRDKLAGALDKTRELVRNLESLDERMRESGSAAGRPGAGASSAPSRTGEQPGARGSEGQDTADATTGGVVQPGGVAPGGGIPGPGRPLTAERVRQFRREFGQRLREAEELSRQLAGNGREGELREIVRGLRALEGSRIYGDPRGLEQLRAAVIDDLKMFEYGLRRAVEGEGGEKLFLAGTDEVPPGWKQLVEEYYRSLSRKPRE